jgi:hypothetical protein
VNDDRGSSAFRDESITLWILRKELTNSAADNEKLLQSHTEELSEEEPAITKFPSVDEKLRNSSSSLSATFQFRQTFTVIDNFMECSPNFKKGDFEELMMLCNET